MPLRLINPTASPPGIPRQNVFHAIDDDGLKYGNATIVEYINEALVPERPLNYYVTVSAMDARAFDILLGAVLARAMEMRRRYPGMPARLYIPSRPGDNARIADLMDFGFENDDCEMRVRKVLTPSNCESNPPVGCFIVQNVLESASDVTGLLQRINEYSLTARSVDWIARMQDEAQRFIVYGAWQDTTCMAEAVLTVYGAEGHVEMIYTQPEFRERGVATSMLDHAGRELLENGIRLLTAEVWQRNLGAVALFRGNRFDNTEPIILYPGVNL